MYVNNEIGIRHGDKLNIDIADTVFCNLSHNVNGLQLSSTSNELVEELTVLKELGFSQLNLIITNINRSQGNTYDLAKCALRKVWSKNKLITSNYREGTESLYQPGGTVTVVLDRWVSMVNDSGKDTAGRWSWATYGGPQTRQITVISAYRVCENTAAEAGPSTAWMQQWKHHREQG
eukprot:10174400-Ditylum_brightwellii.AAC.1